MAWNGSDGGVATSASRAAAKKPSILIPSPNVVRNHQEQNAREFERCGAAKVITENCLTSELLYDTMKKMTESEEFLKKMGDCAGNLAKTDALSKFYSLVLDMLR